MAKLLLGKEVTAAMNEKLQARVAALKEKGVSPKLAIVRCGENPSDLSYEKGATSRAELIGVDVVKFVLPEDVTDIFLDVTAHRIVLNTKARVAKLTSAQVLDEIMEKISGPTSFIPSETHRRNRQ